MYNIETSCVPECSPFDLIIFDLDGTLTDSMPIILEAFNTVFRKYAGVEMNEQQVVAHFGPPEDIIIAQYVKPPAYDEALKDYYAVHTQRTDLLKTYDGIPAVLTTLQERGRRLALYTGASHRSALLRLSATGLLGFFDEILGGDEVEKHKPHPAGLHLILKKFRCPLERAIYVGDTSSDIKMARAAGIKSAGVMWGIGDRQLLVAERPDFTLHQPSDLLSIVFPGRADKMT